MGVGCMAGVDSVSAVSARTLQVCLMVPTAGRAHEVMDSLGILEAQVSVVDSVLSVPPTADVVIVEADASSDRKTHGDSSAGSVVAAIRATTGAAIVVLVDDDDPQVRVECFESGADDVLCRAWGLGDLAARVRVRGTRTTARGGAPSTAVDHASTGAPPTLSLTSDGHALMVRGHMVTVTPRERDLLTLLMAEPLRLFTREELLAAIWGRTWTSEGIVTEYIRRLRTSLRPYGADGCLVTRHRYGYLWDPDRLTDA